MRPKVGWTIASVLVATVFALAACGSADPASSGQSLSGGAEPTEAVRLVAEYGATPTFVPRSQVYTPVSIGEIKQFDDIPPPMDSGPRPSYFNQDGRLELVSRLVPSFGGFYSTNGGTLVIILNDESELDRAVAAIAAYFGAEMITDTVFVEGGGHSLVELREWQRIAQDIVWRIDGVHISGVNQRTRRIEFDPVTSKTAEKVREALADTGIPPGALDLDINVLWTHHNYTLNLRSPLGIEVEFEGPAEVTIGDTADFVTTLTNRGKLEVSVCMLKHWKENVIVFKDGTEVWSTKGRLSGNLTPVCDGVELAPGDSATLKSSWSLIDNDFEPIEPGLYTVGVSIGFSEDSNGLGAGASLRAELRELVVLTD